MLKNQNWKTALKNYQIQTHSNCGAGSLNQKIRLKQQNKVKNLPQTKKSRVKRKNTAENNIFGRTHVESQALTPGFFVIQLPVLDIDIYFEMHYIESNRK